MVIGFADFPALAAAAGADQAVLVQAQLPADGQEAVLGGTAARFYALRAPED